MGMLRGVWGAAAGSIVVLALGSSVIAEEFRPLPNPPLLRFTGVKVSEPFQGLDGKTLPSGTYDFVLSAKGLTAIIGVLLGEKRVAQTTGKLSLDGTDKVSAADFYFDRSSRLSERGGRFTIVATSIKGTTKADDAGKKLSGSLTFQLPPSGE